MSEPYDGRWKILLHDSSQKLLFPSFFVEQKLYLSVYVNKEIKGKSTGTQDLTSAPSAAAQSSSVC